jgi:serine/threonine protein kinase
MPDFFSSKSTESSRQKSSEQKLDPAKSAISTTPILQDHYVLIGPLGQGGMGTVFMAQDTSLFNRLCVVKKLRLDGFNDRDKQKAMEFFQREAKILSELKHPNVVHIQAYFQEHGNYYLVMEYVEGNNLQQLLKKRGTPFTEEQVIQWTTTILNVLNYLHNHEPPVIYRDIKPSNIMLDTVNGIKLVDFGIARPYTENSENTHVVSGGYSPPEQYWGAADPRSDIYALGATMYYLLTGHEPIALQSCSPKLHNVKVSDFIDKIVQRATTQDVWLRYQSAAEMLEALSQNIPRQPVVTPYIYIAVTCLATLIAVLITFVAIGYFDKQPSNSLPLASPPAALIARNNNKTIHENKTGNTARHQAFESATLANSEEIITDPDGFKPPVPNRHQKGTAKSWGFW